MTDNKSLEDTLEGVLFLHSETGTEGGYWAFQDSQFITLNTTRYSCKKCHLYWDKSQNPDGPPVFKKFKNKFCSPDNHEFGLVSDENWSYEGLHILGAGDKLTIYHPDDKREVWSGVIHLKQYPLFTQDASGWWIHADQIGIDRDKWAEFFFKQYPAKLVRSKIDS